MADLTINYKEGLEFSDDQKHRLGVVVRDDFQDKWSYVQLGKNVVFGEVLRDYDFNGTITTDAAKGAEQIIDTGAFTGDAERVRGAVGFFKNHFVAFYVRSRINADTLEVVGLGDNTEIAGGGGLTKAIATATGKYSLSLPGYVFGSTVSGETRGVAQAVGKAGQFGFIKQTGWGGLLVDDAADITKGQGFAPGASGKGYPFASTPSGLNVMRRIARQPWETLDVSAEFGGGDKVVFTYLEIENNMLSYSFPDDRHALNIAKITGSD